jgi:cytochrome c oxidase assembly factor CtaG
MSLAGSGPGGLVVAREKRMRQQRVAPPAAARGRPWLAAAGAALIVAAIAATGLARRYVVAESAQFVVFAMAAPALIAAGAPWRLLRLSNAPGPEPGPPGTAPLDRLAAARRQRTSFLRAAGFLVVFIAAGVAWRLPPVVDALARHPALVAVELVTLLAAGIGLWLELVSSPPLAPRLPNPHRAAIAALAMWSTWAAAYALGLANHAVFHGYDGPGSALSAVADQQITVALVWAVSACCFVPVVFVALLRWLSASENPDEELQRLARDDRQLPVVRGWGRPARGRPHP